MDQSLVQKYVKTVLQGITVCVFSAFHHFIYDINISYHENQIDWVESNLLSVLEGKLHLRCFFSERDKKAGISFSEMTKSKGFGLIVLRYQL